MFVFPVGRCVFSPKRNFQIDCRVLKSVRKAVLIHKRISRLGTVQKRDTKGLKSLTHARNEVRN